MTTRPILAQQGRFVRFQRSRIGNVRFLLLLAISLFIPLSGHAQMDSIEPGSLVNITVVGHPEFSQVVVVHPDGSTDYPLLGNVPIDGMTAEELNQLLTQVLKRVIDRPLVFVNVSHYAMVEIRVVGAVQSPGNTEVRAPADIQNILASVGGITPEADLRRVAIIRERSSGQVTIVIDMVEYAGQDPDSFEAVYAEPGDLIVVPELTRDSYVRVIGAVNLPGPYVPDKHANVIDMIYLAGGPSRLANLNRVRFIRRGDRGVDEQVFDMEDMLERSTEYPEVQPGDVIIISFQDDWKTFGFWADMIRDLALVASSIVILSRI